MEDVRDVWTLAYLWFIHFLPLATHAKDILLWLSLGTRGCLSVSKQNWRTEQTAHLLSTSVGKIPPVLLHTLAYTHALYYIRHTETQILILLTTEDSMLNIGYSITAMCMCVEHIWVYCSKTFMPTTVPFKTDVTEASLTFSDQLWCVHYNEGKFCARNSCFSVNFKDDIWIKNLDWWLKIICIANLSCVWNHIIERKTGFNECLRDVISVFAVTLHKILIFYKIGIFVFKME